jgi:hypothetical protein
LLKRILPFLLLATPAFADEPPATIALPTPLILAIGSYLGTRPYNEVSGMVDAIKACVTAQVPHGGVTTSTGGCEGAPAEVPKKAQ